MTLLFDFDERAEPDEKYWAPPSHKHDWYPATHVWTGETFERMVWLCKQCPEIRGRAK